MPVENKAAYYQLSKTGLFGNAFMTWTSLEEWSESGYRGPIRFRSRAPGSKLFTTGKPYESRGEVVRAYRSAIRAGESPRNIVFCEPAPEQYLTFQGEVCENIVGEICLRWSDEKGITNREAMTRPSGNHSGLTAKLVARRFLDDSDYEWLVGLLETWPRHSVEFSAYSVPVGIFQTRMVVWEVRAY